MAKSVLKNRLILSLHLSPPPFFYSGVWTGSFGVGRHGGWLWGPVPALWWGRGVGVGFRKRKKKKKRKGRSGDIRRRGEEEKNKG